MIRKQIYLTENIQRQLLVRAAQEKKPEAVIIRDLLEKALQQEKSPSVIPDAIKKLDALLDKHSAKTPPDLSLRIDDYLYGEKKF